jgi:four helix bundle protein
MGEHGESTIPDRERRQQVYSYRDLAVWQKAVEIAVECYRVTQAFPKHETYGLSAQLQRAAVSVPANIAEGRSRKYTREFLHHLSIAYGSLAELETHIEIARRLSYLPTEKADALIDGCIAVGRMLNGLHNSLQKRAAAQQPSLPDP